jgi:hypothetical protein
MHLFPIDIQAEKMNNLDIFTKLIEFFISFSGSLFANQFSETKQENDLIEILCKLNELDNFHIDKSLYDELKIAVNELAKVKNRQENISEHDKALLRLFRDDQFLDHFCQYMTVFDKEKRDNLLNILKSNMQNTLQGGCFGKNTNETIDVYFNQLDKIIFNNNRISNSINKLGIRAANDKLDNLKNLLTKSHKHDFTGVASRIPPKTYSFLYGRNSEINSIRDILLNFNKNQIVTIVGLGGIGKTAIARELIEDCVIKEIFDLYCWVSCELEGFTGEKIVKEEKPNFGFEDLINDLFIQLIPKPQPNITFDRKTDLTKNILTQKRTLIVLDNFETSHDKDRILKFLSSVSNITKIIITSRHETLHSNTHLHKLNGLESNLDSVSFLRNEGLIRGIDVISGSEDDDLLEIRKACGGAPLAMKLIVGQLNRLPLTDVLKLLKDANFNGPTYDFYKFIFHRTWEILEINSKILLVSMSAFSPNKGIPKDVIQKVSSLELEPFNISLEQLVKTSLVDPSGTIKLRLYSLHQLTHNFVLSDILEQW